MCIWTESIEQINRRGKKGTTESAYEFRIYQEDKGDLIIHIKACDQSDFFYRAIFAEMRIMERVKAWDKNKAKQNKT